MTAWSHIGDDLRSTKLLRAVVVGWLIGAMLVIHCLMLATIIFSGPLLPYAMQGVGMILFGSVAFCLLGALASSFRGMIAAPHEVPAMALGSLGAGVVAATSGMSAESPFMTMVVLVIASGVLTSLVFVAIGQLRLASLFRFIPYPVAGGFFAGSGWVLSVAAFSVMCGVTVELETLPRLLDSDMLWKWGPGAAYGLVLAFLTRRRSSLPLIMGSVVLVVALYHLGLSVLGISLDEAKADGLLLSGMPVEGLWPAFQLGDLTHVDWRVIAQQLPNLLVVVLVTLLVLLVNLSGLEVATDDDIDLDREFRVAGAAGVFAGAGGSGPGGQLIVLPLLCRALGADTAWTGIVAAATLGLALVLGDKILGLVPASIMGGLLLFFGLQLLDTWLIEMRRKLHWVDYGIVVLIGVAIASFGFVEGVAAGMIATLSLFALRLSRVEVIAEEFTARERHSHRTRPIPDRTILLDRGALIRAYRLRGYIFFGSVHALVDRLGQALDHSSRPACLLLDFSDVPGCDFTAIHVLCKFVRAADSSGTRVVISAAPARFEESLRSNLAADIGARVRFEPDPDHALEYCEDFVIAMTEAGRSGGHEHLRGPLLEKAEVDLLRHLEEQAFFEEMLEQLDPWVERRAYDAGEKLTVRGEIQEGMQLLVSGNASVHDARGLRLSECSPGDVLESRAAFGTHPASATAIARDACRTVVLTPDARRLLEADDQAIGLRLYAFIIGRPAPGGSSLPKR